MKLPTKLKYWFRALFQKRKLDADLDEEMRSHIELRTQVNIEAGMKPEEARYAAMRQFGWKESIQEKCRDLRGVRWLENLWQDIRFGARQLRKSPGFTAIAVVSISLGVGASTAVFSLVNAILLRSLPVPRPHELRVLEWSGSEVRMSSFEGVSVQSGNRWSSADCVTHLTFQRLRDACAVQADVFGFCPVHEAVASVRGESFVAAGMMVSGNFFSGLDARPRLGRLLSEDKDFGGVMNVVISHEWWKKYFGGDPAAIGQALALNGISFTIAGVLPPGFPSVRPGATSDFYVPMSAGSPFLYTPISENWHWFVRLMARMKPGAADSQFRAALDVVFARETSAIMKEPKMQVEPGRGGFAYDRNSYGKPLAMMLGAVSLVMLIACANLAGFLLSRGAARHHELALRTALGAGRWRLIRQSLTESMLLGILGSGLGILLALWGSKSISRLWSGSPDGLRYDLSLDLTVLGFCLATAFATSLLSGLLPALWAGRADPVDGLKSRGHSGALRLRTGRFLVGAQICLSLLLLTGAGLYIRSFANLTRVEAGFNIERLLLVGLNLRAGGYTGTNAVQFYERAVNSVAALPGVRAATFSSFPLLNNDGWSGGFAIKGRDLGAEANSSRLPVGETFFPTMGIPIKHGRGFEPADTGPDSPKVVVVNEKLVQKYLPGEDAVGLTFQLLGVDWRIVGVCQDFKYDNIKMGVEPTVYMPLKQLCFSPSIGKNMGAAWLAVRTALPPLAAANAVRKTVAQIDPRAAVAKVTTQTILRDQGISQERLLAAICGAVGGLALFLAGIGLYGLMAYNVARRTSEFGIRMALGATRRIVAFDVLREAGALAAFGLGVGFPGALIVARLVRSQLYGVGAIDFPSLSAASLLLIAVAMLSAWIPARRAAQVEPMAALRAE